MNQKLKHQFRRLTEDGLLRDGKEWTAEDWRDLWTAYQEAVRKISERHRGRIIPPQGGSGTAKPIRVKPEEKP